MSRTVLVGLDGATFSVLDALMAAGHMPFLADVVANGVRGDLESTKPAVSPTAWTSIATGCRPGNHGVFDFIRAQERAGEVYFTLYDARDIEAETIWSIASRRGLRVTVLNYMLTFPPRPINGYMAPGLVSWRHFRRGMQPSSLYETVRSLFGSGYREMAWDFDLEKKVLRGIGPAEYERWIQFHIRRERRWFKLARHLMKHDPCDLTAVVFDGVDKLQHICWRFLDPDIVPVRPTEWEQRIRSLCLEYFHQVDGYLAEISRLAGSDARLFIVSDHGFGPTREVFRVNVWLHERGHLEWAPTAAADAATQQSVERRLNSNFALLDWERTRAYAQTPSCNGLVLRTPKPESSDAAADGYLNLRNELIEGLVRVESPLTGEPVVTRVLTREEAFPGRWMQKAPDLYLELADHGFVSIRNMRPVVEVRPEVAGTHRPNGIFLATGPGIRRGAEIEGLSVIDMAPLLLHSLQNEVVPEMDGRVPVEVFETSWLRRNQVRVPIGAAAKPDIVAQEWDWDEAGLDPEGEATILKRLADLGYIEQ